MINKILIASTSTEKEEAAKNALENRSLLYNKDKNKLFVKYNNELNPIGANPDNKNIIENENGDIALKDIPTVDGIVINQNGSDNWRGQRLLGNITSEMNILLFFPKDEAQYIGGEILQKGTNVHGHYEISLTNTGSRAFKGATSDAKKANLISCTYQGKIWYGIRFYSENTSKIFFSGWFSQNTIIVGGSEVSEIVDLNDNADTGTVIVNGIGGYFNYEFSQEIAALDDFGDHFNYSFDDHLKITTHKQTRQVPGATFTTEGRVINVGKIECKAATTKAEPLLTFTANKKSSFKILFSSTNNNAVGLNIGYGNNLVASEVSKNNKDLKVLEISTTEEGPFKVFTNAAVNIWYIDFSLEATTEEIVNSLDNLPETGPNGAPHIVKLSKLLNKSDLIQISEACQNSNVRMIIDLSNCTVAEDASKWAEDDATNKRCLNKLFSGCRSLRAFSFPKGVKNAGGFTFQNCPFLEKVIIPDEVHMMGISSWTNFNTGFLQGTSVQKIWLPKDYGKGIGHFDGFIWAGCECFKIYWPPESWLKNNWTSDDQFTVLWTWAYFAYADDRMRFYVPCHKKADGSWNTNDGELYSKFLKFGKHEVNSGSNNFPSNRYTFKPKQLKDLCIPYDIEDYETMRALDEKLL